MDLKPQHSRLVTSSISWKLFSYNILMEQMGRLLVVMGGIVALIGFLLMLGPKLPFRLGRLPLDFHYQRDNFSFYFPLGTSILISIVLTLIFGLLNRR